MSRAKRGRFDWGRFRAWASGTAAVVVLGSVLGGLALGTPALERAANERLARSEVRVVFDWPVSEGQAQTWLPQEFRDELLATAYGRLVMSRDRLSAGPLEAVGRALVETNWFADGPIVEWTAPGEIRVRGRWRTPAGVVRIGERDRLIASSGHLLPHSWPVGTSGLPVITGIRYAPSAWPSEAVRASLQLLGLLRDRAYWSQVAGIDASRFDEAQMLGIITDSGARVWWGAPPGTAAPERFEVRTEQKLQNLAEVHRITGRIDAGQRELAVYTDGVRLDRR